MIKSGDTVGTVFPDFCIVRRIGKTKPPVILGVIKKSFSNRITLLCLL